MTRLALVGGGRMGEALLTGLLAREWASPEELAVVEKLPGRRDELSAAFPGVQVVDEPVAAEGAVVAVKPADVDAACAALGAAGVDRVLSIAAGVPLARLEAGLPAGTPVVRAMPNTPALVGAGAAAIAGGSSAGDDDMVWAESILGAVGTVVRVPEKLLDAVTGLSGSGPAYVFLVAEALIEAGVLVGLPRDVSVALTTQTLLGAARLLAETGDSPEALRAMVTSPGGTTAAGIHVLEAAGARAAFMDAVAAATARSAELVGAEDTRQFPHEPHPRTVATSGGRGSPVAQPSAQARFLTVAEVAATVRVSTMTVYRLIKAGDLPAVRVGKSYRLREDDVDAYLARQYTQAG